MIVVNSPLNRDYTKDPIIKARKRRGFINHGSTLNLIEVLGHSRTGWGGLRLLNKGSGRPFFKQPTGCASEEILVVSRP